MAGFASLLGGGLAGLAGANAQAGATAAQNEALNNSGAPGDVKSSAENGGLLTKAGAFASAVGDWFKDTYGDPVGSIENWVGQFGGLAQSDANKIMSEPPLVQVAQGVYNGASAAPDAGGNLPGGPDLAPATGPTTGQVPTSITGGTPPNATFASGNSGDDSGSASTGNDGGNAGSDNNSLLDPKGENHVLYGDGPTSGGHLAGVGKPGKSEFPVTWGAQDITNAISDIATDPKTQWSPPNPRNGYVTGTGTVNGVDIKVVYDPNKGRIVTGYPTNLPRNPK